MEKAREDARPPTPDLDIIPAVPDAKSKAASKSGVVVPYTLNWWRRALVFVIALLIRMVAATLRCRWEFHPAILANQNRPVVFCTWHNRVLLTHLMYRGYLREVSRGPAPATAIGTLAAVVSASRDGAIIAGVLKCFGIESARGSSSRRGTQALLESITAMEHGRDLAVTPDGPRGPRYIVQMGAIALAQLAGKPIIPLASGVRGKICLKSWDRFQIPLPFSSTVIRFGEPLNVPPDQTSDEQRELLRSELQRRLEALTED